MEESSIGVPFSQPVNLRFNSLELLFSLKDIAKLPSKVRLEVAEERDGGVEGGPLDAS